MEYQCPVCSARVAGEMLVYLDHTEKHILDLVKTDHPDWVEKDGICAKCVEYYRQELKGSVFGDAACVKRERKIKGFLRAVAGILKSGKK